MSERPTLSLKAPLPAKTARKLAKATRRPKTKAEIREEQKAARIKRDTKILETREWLSSRFPAAFKGKGKPKLPLAIGIDREILGVTNEMSRKQIRRAIGDYTSGPTYHRAVAKGGFRININGAPTTEILPEHVEKARAALEKIKSRRRPRG